VRREIADRERISIEEKKDIYAKGWEVKRGDNLATPWCTGSR